MGAIAMTLTNKQIAYLHVLKTQNGMQDNEYRELLEEAAGVTSSTQLDNEGLNSVLDLMSEHLTSAFR